jgi:non-ribosomal peptide synthetase component E (peptide arylation enzyme)
MSEGLAQHDPGQMLDDTIRRYPDNEALVYVDRDLRMTYTQFGQVVDQLARGLMALGVARGKRWRYGRPMCPTGWPCNLPRPKSGRSF